MFPRNRRRSPSTGQALPQGRPSFLPSSPSESQGENNFVRAGFVQPVMTIPTPHNRNRGRSASRSSSMAQDQPIATHDPQRPYVPAALAQARPDPFPEYSRRSPARSGSIREDSSCGIVSADSHYAPGVQMPDHRTGRHAAPMQPQRSRSSSQGLQMQHDSTALFAPPIPPERSSDREMTNVVGSTEETWQVLPVRRVRPVREVQRLVQRGRQLALDEGHRQVPGNDLGGRHRPPVGSSIPGLHTPQSRSRTHSLPSRCSDGGRTVVPRNTEETGLNWLREERMPSLGFENRWRCC